MEVAIDHVLHTHPAVSGSLVADANGLLISAKGDLQRGASEKSGLFTSIGRLAQKLPSSTATLTSPATVIIETVGDKQILVKKVGEFTVCVHTDDNATREK